MDPIEKFYTEFGKKKTKIFLTENQIDQLFCSLEAEDIDRFLESPYDILTGMERNYKKVEIPVYLSDNLKDHTLHTGSFRRIYSNYSLNMFVTDDSEICSLYTSIEAQNELFSGKDNIKTEPIKVRDYIFIAIKNSDTFMAECRTLYLVYKVDNILGGKIVRMSIAECTLVSVSVNTVDDQNMKTQMDSDLFDKVS